MKRLGILALMALTAVTAVVADDTGSNAGHRGAASNSTVGSIRSNAAETGLIRIRLFDDGLRVLALYGDPDSIEAVGTGGGGGVGPAAGGGGAGAAGPRGAGGTGRGGGGAPDQPPVMINRPFDWSNEFLPDGSLRVQEPGGDSPVGPPVGAGQGPGGPPSGPAGVRGAGGGGGAPRGAPGATPGATGGTGDRVLFTRWVYKRGPSRYGFILDRFNRVVQIEAIGMNDSRVNTNRGIKFGSRFSDLIKRYGAPDGYEIAGDNLVVRYLVRQKVAFRLNRLKANMPHVVTGVVVSAGKQ